MEKNKTMSRRQFLLQSMFVGGAGYLALEGLRPAFVGANDRIRVAVIGLGSRGVRHVHEYLQIPNVEIAAICDLDSHALAQAAEVIATAGRQRPQTATDYRRLLDVKNIDILSLATPRGTRNDLATHVCEAGINMLVEKPFCSDASDGARIVKMVEEKALFVQQTEGQAFTTISEISSVGAPEFTSIDTIRLSKDVHLTERGDFRTKTLPGVRDDGFLLEYAFDELDAARCILGADILKTISPLVFGTTSQSLQKSVMLAFDFETPEGMTRKIDFELRIHPGVGTQHRNASDTSDRGNGISMLPYEFETRGLFSGPTGSFTVRDSSANKFGTGGDSAWSNLVASVRSNRPEFLQNPISESQRSMRLLQFAEQSIRQVSGSSFECQAAL